MKTKGISSINIVTLGCSKNTVDSEFLMRQLETGTIRVMHNAGVKDSRNVIINTCGFIKDAKQESVDTILEFARAKLEGKIDRLIVMGCLSERYKPELEKEIPEVDKYFGVNDIKPIIETIGINYKKELAGERIISTPGHYAYLKISEGCDRTCSFCAIPMIRGKHKSKPMDELLKEARFLGNKGVKEIILIAQDLTYYGIDIYKKQKISELLQKLADLPYFEWIRLHYAYPASFPRDLIGIMKERKNICKYIDIPFQHISDNVLRNMRRNYNKAQTKELIEFIRSEIPEITIRTTLLVGHPGEGEKEFNELVEFVIQSRFERLGAFTYSEEEDTFAATAYKNATTEKVKLKRLEKIMAIQQEISSSQNSLKTGKIFKVLIDRIEDEFYVGRTESDSPEVDNEVLVKKDIVDLKPGSFYQVKITSTEDYDLYGEVVP